MREALSITDPFFRNAAVEAVNKAEATASDLTAVRANILREFKTAINGITTKWQPAPTSNAPDAHKTAVLARWIFQLAILQRHCQSCPVGCRRARKTVHW